MMSTKIKYIFTPVIAAAALLWGCSGSSEGCAGDGGTEELTDSVLGFRGSSENPMGITRAVADFPNTTIGVSATYDGEADWWSYSDLDNAIANVTGESGGIFSFTWPQGQPHYWPFDGAALNFVAYSPHSSTSSALTLLNDLTTLRIDLADNLPDVLYATENSILNAWSKPAANQNTPVDLVTFNHALSQLTVNVVGDETFNEDITIESLVVRTSRGSAYLDLLAGDNGNLTFLVVPDFDYGLVTSSTSFSQAKPFSKSVFLFPGTEEQTQILITLKDKYFSLTAGYTLSNITFDKADDNDPDRYLNLVRAANTVVNIIVKSTTVQNPNEDIVIQGQLTDWIDMGDLEVTIN